MGCSALTTNAPPNYSKEFGVKADQGPFLSEQDVGGRAKAEYPRVRCYSVQRYGLLGVSVNRLMGR